VVRLVLDLAWLYVRVAVSTIWRDRWFRFWIWLLAVGIALCRMASGQMSLDDILNEILLGIIISMPFLR
jgi:hypothetical protein